MRARVLGARHPFSASNGYGRWSVTAIHATGVGDHEFLRIPPLTSNAAFQASAWSFSTCCAGRYSCSQGTVRRRWVNAENMFRKTRRGALPAASDTASGHCHCVSSIPFHTHRHAPAMRANCTAKDSLPGTSPYGIFRYGIPSSMPSAIP